MIYCINIRSVLVTFILAISLTSCTPATQVLPVSTSFVFPEKATVTADTYFLSTSSSGGDPRSPGYWLLWNTCAENNQSATAKANGGRAAGWVLVDDLLADPGIWLGQLQVAECDQALQLLQARGLDGKDRAGDLAYGLARELLTAQLNLGVWAEDCQAVDDAVLSAQALMEELGFDGQRGLIGSGSPTSLRPEAELLLSTLQQYNAGTLCVEPAP